MIGFDAKRAFANYAGLGNYSRFVIDALSARFPEQAFRLYTPRRRAHPGTDALLARANISVAEAQGLYRLLGPLWRSYGLTADLAADGVRLFHGLSNELPLGLRHKGVKAVVTVHDLVFLRFPKLYKAHDRAVYTQKTRYACAAADRIIAISECTKRDVVSFLDVDPEKVEVICQGCAPEFFSVCSEEEKKRVSAKYRLPERYLLNVGTVEPRKNVLLAAKALSRLDADLHLVVIGRKTDYAREVQDWAAANGLRDRLHIFSGVPFQDLPALYQSAAAFVYPSIFEGFGIPVLEAAASGVPVVAAVGSSLEEAGGPGCLYIEPDSVEQLAEALARILSDSALRERMIAGGREHAAGFSAGLLAERLMDCYRSVCGKLV